MKKHVVGTVEEIPPGERKIVEIAGRLIGVFNIDGEFFALRNQCPHQGGPLCKGRVTGFLKARVPGEYKYIRKGEILHCPWHGWEFDLKTGQSWWDPVSTRVRNYKVNVENIRHIDEVEKCEESGLKKGPYTAETYPVSVEQQYVVVEIS